jgi:hypothetical protein
MKVKSGISIIIELVPEDDPNTIVTKSMLGTDLDFWDITPAFTLRLPPHVTAPVRVEAPVTLSGPVDCMSPANMFTEVRVVAVTAEAVS